MTLKDGKTGMVLKIVKIHESDLKQRMMTMGLIPGTKVTVLRSAPLGDPIASTGIGDLPKSNVLKGLPIRGSQVKQAEEDVMKWLEKIGMLKK